ncbi:MAG: hypothetical protein BroJett039_05280 [Chloroflexota bacterium]|nr:MAG: hypothetical protein BroJett039_05280 [Chloroflexota bacterium]
MRSRHNALLYRIAALALLALAFFLRVYRLGEKNIWWDEGWTVWMAKHDFAWIALRTASDEHPPLHYWLMNVWQTVFGADVFTGRFFSVIFGALLVAVVYRLGKEIGGARLGLLAALFLSLARFQIWWAQDIKNYTLSAFFAWASVLFVWKLFFDGRQTTDDRRKILFWIGYALATFLALFSHYLAALIVLANNVFAGIVLISRWRRGEKIFPLLLKWSLAQVAVVILFLPWLGLYLQNGATWSAAPTFDFGLFLRLAATVLALGVTTYIENYTWIVAGILLIAGLSLGWVIRRQTTDDRPQTATRRPSSVVHHRSSAVVYLFLIALIPPALIYILALTPAAIFAPKIQARYLMMLTPALALLLALGVLFVAENTRGRAARIVSAALVLFIVAAQIFALRDYFSARVLRDEYTTLSQVVNNFGFDDDAIVLNTDQEYPTFLYYLEREFDWIGVPNGAPVNAETAARIAAQTAPHNAVWVVTIPDALQKDPQRLVERSIAERLPKQYEQNFGDKRLALYASEIRNVKDAPRENFSPLAARDAVLDERLKLVGVDLPLREAFGGDVVSVVTYWQAQDLTTINLSLQKQNGEIVARAAIPISIGARERAQADLRIPPDVNVNELRVVAQARLNALPIGSIQVLPRSEVNVNVKDATMQPRAERFGEHIALVGVNLPTRKFRAGESVPLTLFWQTAEPLQTSYSVFAHLLGEQYNPAQDNFLWGQVDRIPVEGKLPTTAWAPNQTIVDAYQIKLDNRAPAGAYKIEIGLYDANGARLRVFDASDNDLGDALIAGEIQVGN